jgi:cell division protein FtsZ
MAKKKTKSKVKRHAKKKIKKAPSRKSASRQRKSVRRPVKKTARRPSRKHTPKPLRRAAKQVIQKRRTVRVRTARKAARPAVKTHAARRPSRRRTKQKARRIEVDVEAGVTPIFSKKPQSLDDQEISKFAETMRTKVYIIGVGGSGSNTMTRMSELHIEGANLIAANTDAPHLENTRAHRKILLGRGVTKGLGAGNDPTLGEEAAIETEEEIKRTVNQAQLVFINCGLGGGTGTGAAPIIAAEAKSAGALTVALVTLPFTSEGKIRMERAIAGLARLRKSTDTTIVIPNDKLLALAPELTLDKAFKKVDDVLANATKGIIEMVTRAGMVNLDFADLKSVLKDSGYALIGVGESHANSEDKRIESVINEMLDSPLLDIDITKARRALVNIIGGKDLTLKEAENVFHAVTSRINEDATLKWGARIDPTMPKHSLKVMLVMSGVGLADYIEKSIKETEEEMDTDDLGIGEID